MVREALSLTLFINNYVNKNEALYTQSLVTFSLWKYTKRFEYRG